MAKSFDAILTNGFPEPEETTPAEIFGQLSTALRKKVAYKIDFTTVIGTSGSRVTHRLRVEVRTLQYIAELIQMSHDVIKLYPCRVTYGAMSVEANNEEHLRTILGEIVTKGEFAIQIGTLLAQA